MTFKPMLAGKAPEDLTTLKFPILGSPKLDGIRCITSSVGPPVSRNLKPIPNSVVREILSGLPRMDGELTVGDAKAKNVFNVTSSGVMSADGVPKFTFWVFDALLNRDYPFSYRLEVAKQYANSCGKNVQLVPHKILKTVEEVLEYEAKMLLAGFEGIMLRDPDGPYKHGRSTTREGWLLKLKRFEDAEAIVIGFEEKMHNDNPITKDALGRAKRTSHQANKIPADTLGSLVVRSEETGVQFSIGSGFSEVERNNIWRNRGQFLGKLVKYRFQPTGVKDAPRFPTFLGWRDVADL